MDWVDLCDALPAELQRKIFIYAFEGTPSAQAVKAAFVGHEHITYAVWRACFESVWEINQRCVEERFFVGGYYWVCILPTSYVEHFFGAMPTPCTPSGCLVL
jgi:hypothetical protein